MDPKVKVEDDKLLCLKYDHNGKILLVVLDDQVPFPERFLCEQCMETKQSVFKQATPINAAISLMKERINKRDQQDEELRVKWLNIIKKFSEFINDLQSKFMKLFNEIQRINSEWIKELEGLKRNIDLHFVVKEFEFLNNNDQNVKNSLNITQKYKSYVVKLTTQYKKLLMQKDFQKGYCLLQKMMEQEEIKKISSNVQGDKLINNQDVTNARQITVDQVKLIQSRGLGTSHAMAFNKEGNILVAGFSNTIIVSKFENETLTEIQSLEGHSQNVYCLLFSKKSNEFFSGSLDKTIKRWRETKEKWECTTTKSNHASSVVCIIMNKNEDQLISCSYDKTIIIWKIDQNIMECIQTLDKHTGSVYSISLNESETALVSCSYDQQIILWVKDQQWVYQHHIKNDDYGKRICFLDDNSIIWQEQSKGISHQFKIENGQLIPKPELQIKLNNETYDCDLFPTIVNKSKQIIIQKHHRFIYILKRQENGQLILSCDPIDQGDSENYGTLSDDGQYLAVWSKGNGKLRIIKIIYK